MSATKQPVTEEQLAAFDFEPWTHKADEWAPPTDAEWAQMARTHLVALRFAWAALHKTKPELMTMVEEIDEDAGNDLMNRFVGSISFFEGVLAILRGAEARICVQARLSTSAPSKRVAGMPCDLPVRHSLRSLLRLRWHLHRIRSARRLLELAEAHDRVARELRAAALDIADAEERALGLP